MPKQQTAFVENAFERALELIRARVCASTPAGQMTSFAIAHSGGLDSTALLHIAYAYAKKHRLSLFAFHVHHGISPNADAWLEHCKAECTRLDIRFSSKHISLTGCVAGGVEQAARIWRYAALGDLCRSHQVPLLLTAHHRDDQVETVFLQLLRGSGVAGLSGMENANTAPDLLGDPSLILGRPLLDVSRADLEDFVERRASAYVEDESNLDVRYARNALRRNVMPSLSTYFPGFQERVARTAHHAQSAQRLLDEFATQDLASCLDGDGVDITRLRTLSPDRVHNLLRYWFSLRGMRMPSTAWLQEMCEQLLTAREDARVRVTHADCEVRRHRDRVFLTPRVAETSLGIGPISFRWCGEAQLHFPLYGGSLYFDEVEEGVDSSWLRGRELLLRHRAGGEKLKSAPNRHTRSLKHHYQALGIPAWERQQLPVLISDGRLLFAAGVGMNWHDFPTKRGEGISLRWKKKS